MGCIGVALAKLVAALGPQRFLDTNMLISATQKSRVGGMAQREAPT